MNDWLPSLNSLRAFEVVSRHLNYHTAARELKVTPAAVKQLVAKLEDSIGGKLFERQGQNIVLTNRGEGCRHDLSLGFEQIASSVEKMRQEETGKQLVVTVETSFATTWLVPKLDQFRILHPEINILIDSSQHIANLNNERIDVAIRYGVMRQSDLFIHRLFDDQVFPACSPALAEGPPKLFRLQDLNSVPLIHWDLSQLDWIGTTRKWFTWQKWLSHCGVENVDTNRGLHFSDYGQAVQAAIAGQGVFLASWPILKEPLNSGILVCPFEERVTTDIGYDIAATEKAKTRPEVNAFIKWIIKTADSQT